MLLFGWLTPSAQVVQVRKKDTNRIYAMKILKKNHLIERDEVAHTKSERLILEKNTNPFLVGLKFSFQNSEKVCRRAVYSPEGCLSWCLSPCPSQGAQMSLRYVLDACLLVVASASCFVCLYLSLSFFFSLSLSLPLSVSPSLSLSLSVSLSLSRSPSVSPSLSLSRSLSRVLVLAAA